MRIYFEVSFVPSAIRMRHLVLQLYIIALNLTSSKNENRPKQPETGKKPNDIPPPADSSDHSLPNRPETVRSVAHHRPTQITATLLRGFVCCYTRRMLTDCSI